VQKAAGWRRRRPGAGPGGRHSRLGDAALQAARVL